MPRTATVLGVKTLPSAVALHASSPSSTHPLIALASPSTSSESKVSLYRTSAGSDLVWEWTNVGIAPKPTAGGLGLKGKAKAAPVGKIDQLAWSPRGSYLAVAISPATPSSCSTLAILSLHDGKPLYLPPVPLPTTRSVSHLSWQELDYAVDASLSSWSIELVRQLPGLPRIVKQNPGGAGGGPGTAGGPALGNFAANPGGAGGGGGGVFGAKQAMLERERAKEAQRTLNLQETTGDQFPTVLSDVRPDEVGGTGDQKVKSVLRSRGEAHDETEKTVLCVGDEEGKIHLYLGGSVFLGTVDAGGDGTAIVGVQVLPSDQSPSLARFVVHFASSTTLSTRQLSLPLPPSLQIVIRQSSAVRSTIHHAFESLQEVRNLWDEARRIGKGWLQRIADVSRPQGVVLPPVTQLHLLLMTGRPTRSLHDFLASKMNERGLFKWEQEMGLAIDKLKRVGWMSVVPALERTIVLLLEIDAWARWPDKFAMYSFDRKTILRAIKVAKEAIKSTLRLQAVVEEEERCFKAFSVWLHYELDKLAQQEGSEVRPNAAFHPVPVSSYIQDSLSPLTSPINPFLSMGLASISLAQNSAILTAQKWVDQLEVGNDSKVSDESLEAIIKRLGEELHGQKERDHLAAHVKARQDAIEVDDFSIEPPFAQGKNDVDEARPLATSTNVSSSIEGPVPSSIPILLHCVGKLVGEVMSTALKRVGTTTTLGDVKKRGSFEDKPGEDAGAQARKTRRVRSSVSSDDSFVEAWLGKTTLHIERRAVQDAEQFERAAFKLSTRDDSPLTVFDFDFVSSTELAVAIDLAEAKGNKQYIVSLDLQSIHFTDSCLPDDIPCLPFDTAIALDSHFPPSHISIARLDDRTVAWTLAGEGRRLELHDFESSPSGDGMDVL